ncbi:MAG: TRAP transporter large permease [Lentisphaerae bacterium]|jgi:C4-dicarboxylate transporter DctM subunit|nr:TRAP transporter large permease [Lentisphaerota bacterium]
MSTFTIGILGFVLMLLLLFLSMPVGFVMAVTGCLGFAAIRGSLGPAVAMALSETYDTFSKYDYSVIPLFIFMGQVAFHSGISRRLFDAAYCWLGRLPGGLGVAAVGACAAFGSICGSGPATAATMAAVAMPEMKKHKYDLALSAGAVASGGSLGMLIPPSVVFIVYGFMTEQSPAKLFLAGVIPGLMYVVLFGLYIVWACWRKPELGPPAPPASARDLLRSLLGVIDPLLLFALVMGGMFCGWFTPIEAAAVGAFGSLLIAAFRKCLTWKMLWRSLQETVRTSCMVLIIIAGAMIFGRFLAITRLPVALAEFLGGLPLPGWMILVSILLFFVLMGTVVDALAMILMTIPVFLPVLQALNVDLIWFGVLVVTVVQIGVISPPVGVNVYVVCGMMRGLPLQTAFRGCVPFMILLLLGTAILFLFPQISLWLPNQM